AVVAQAETGGTPELRALAARAQKRFDVELAIVCLVNGDRLWHTNNTGVFPMSAPLELTYCKHTIEGGAPLVVGNTARDRRFADNPLKQVSFINFYAGIPLEASDGRTIGTFSLHGSRPRLASRFPVDELRAMALEAQAELRRHEVPVPA
ncbi:GAF domain-containing protein, partial [Pseudolysinimonas sp.]